MHQVEQFGITINAPRFAPESAFTISTLQNDARSAAFTVCCKHCVTGGRHSPDFEHLLGEDEGQPGGIVQDEGPTLEQMTEDARRGEKADDKNAYRRRQAKLRKLGRRP